MDDGTVDIDSPLCGLSGEVWNSRLLFFAFCLWIDMKICAENVGGREKMSYLCAVFPTWYNKWSKDPPPDVI